MTKGWHLPDDPDIVRVRVDSIGWTDDRRFGDVWLARSWLWHFLDPGAHRRSSPAPRPRRRASPPTLRRHRGHQSPLPAVPGEFALAEHWRPCCHRPEGTARRPLTPSSTKRPALSHPRPLAGSSSRHRERSQSTTRHFVPTRLRTAALRSHRHALISREGLAEDNDLAQRGYSRDHRSDCKQVVIASDRHA